VGAAPKVFLLFAGGEPNRGDDGRAIASGLKRQTLIFPTVTPNPPSQATPPWEFPVEQRSCIKLVTEMAEPTGDRVRVIDVNSPGTDRRLVDRWAGSDSLLPVLVAPSGRRLEGLDAFVPGRLRRFLASG